MKNKTELEAELKKISNLQSKFLVIGFLMIGVVFALVVTIDLKNTILTISLFLIEVILFVKVIQGARNFYRVICPNCDKGFFIGSGDSSKQVFPLGKIKKCVHCGVERP